MSPSLGSNLLVLLLSAAPAAAQRKPFSLPACERAGPGLFVFGLSGPAQDKSDEFGRDNLRAFAEGVGPDRLALFAPAPSAGGPFKDPLSAPEALKALASRPERSLRLMFTGHGTPEGMWLGRTKRGEDLYVEPADLAAALKPARRAGKTVKGLFLACYSGRFAEALMPSEGLAPACGAFSTLPEKKAEGCYEEGSGERRLDYLASAAGADSCRPGRDWREVHGRVFERLEGYDIPMLTSDYFLLYGPAAGFLGRGARAPYPRRSLVRKRLEGDIVVYADLVNNRVVKALRHGRILPPPGVSVVDCASGLSDVDLAMDGLHESAFFLHRGIEEGGDPPSDCVPVLRLDWGGNGAAAASATVAMAAEPEDEAWDPSGSSRTLAKFKSELKPDELLAPIEGLKPGARLMLSRVLPMFKESERGEELERRLQGIADWAEAQDPARAKAMRALLREMRRGGSGREVYEGTRFWGSWLRSSLIDLVSEADTQEGSLDYSRLALLVAVTAAEKELRTEARADEAARRLVLGLESLRACERGLP